MPPIAHRLPCSIVSHRSRSSTTCSPLRGWAGGKVMMRSITSTPRVEPMRQGVHLPQLSIAQNSIA